MHKWYLCDSLQRLFKLQVYNHASNMAIVRLSVCQHLYPISHSSDLIRAGCFALFVLLVSCDCYCSVTLPYGAVVWSAVCDYGIS